MHGSRIQKALMAGAGVQCAMYAALWYVLAQAAPMTPDASDLVGTTYKITTAEGDVHLLSVDSPDPSQVLVQASARFEHVASIDRLEPTEALEVLRSQQRGHWWVLGLFVFPVAFLLVGTHVGARERTLESVFAALAPTLSEDIDALSRRTGLDAKRLQREVERIRVRGLADLRWDAERGRVYDTRLSAYNVVLQFCPHCNDPISVRIRADLTSVPRCPNCMTTFDTSVLARMNEDLVARLLSDPSARTRPGTTFSLVGFLFWTVAFPPIALVTALRASG